ncbi:hypothetical protein GCM10010435_94400 [Winogradskya consettensis]|uniref:Small secreted protein n=1 Tax=Winogradskya consettensis TaxID=113560 RepID=A0A919T2M9_9ACTN|nr:hypothetical protein [Actinoplanes consettensis]GIM84145.1 hypothetical protein Aco04nite_89950 [Actinoplanes consettensis]
MRRLLCVTALSGALLLGACSSSSSDSAAAPAQADASPSAGVVSSAPEATSATSAAASSSGGDAALKGDTAAICTQAAKTGGEAARNFAADVKLLIDAQSAQDADAVTKAKEKTTRDVENYSYALADMAKLTSDPALKRALTAMGKQVSTLKGDVRKLDAEKLAGLQETLSKACGNS